MKQSATKRERAQAESAEIVTGHFSKREAATHIIAGCHHLHSSTLGARDPLAAISRQSVLEGKSLTYPWELTENAKSLTLGASADRHAAIKQVETACSLALKRFPREKVQNVLEELITNAIYHAYSTPEGRPKYPRSKPATLADTEKIQVTFQTNESGVYLCIEDRGGHLSFPRLSSGFARCYGAQERQIEQKEGGAGLGLYMVFEIATHVKIDVSPGKSTRISCWLPEPRGYDPDHFSFNFFERR